MPAAVAHVLGPDQGEMVHLLALGVRFMIDGERTGGAFSLVEHPLPPRALGAPLHTHRNEDEYSFVLEGRFGVQLGDDVLEAGPGDLVLKPRGVAHAFWNAGEEPARLLELISPAGFENYFREVAPLLAAATRDQAAIGEVVARYRLDIDFTTIPTLAAARPAPGVACAGGRARRSGRGGGEVEVETWDAIRSRRNVRSYREQAIAPEDLARRLLGLPGDRFCAWLVSLGVPADRPLSPVRRPNRRPFDEVVHRGHW